MSVNAAKIAISWGGGSLRHFREMSGDPLAPQNLLYEFIIFNPFHVITFRQN
jgi:hypothetical protein